MAGAGGAPSLDHLYEQGADFSAVYERIAGAVLEAAQALPEGAELVYAVPGHPALGEATVPRLRTLARAAGTALRLVPGLSFVDSVAAVLEEDLGEGLRVADALALGRLDPTVPLLVCQVYSRRVASGVKLALGKHYPDEHPVVLIRAAGVPGQERVSRRPLYELDRDDLADHLTSLWVPPLAPLEALREPQTLQEVMARLRAPDGCPWDREQTHASLRKYLLEETYETLEALDAGDVAALEEELGDLLLQIVFHAQVADEAGEFDLGDVVAGIVAKLIRRHPHVFGDEATGGGAGGQDAQAVLRNWEALKRAERDQKGAAGGAGAAGDTGGTGEGNEGGGRSMLDGVPGAMPALAYAQAVQERVARVGFDWPDVAGVVEKVAEEARELAEAPPEDDKARRRSWVICCSPGQPVPAPGDRRRGGPAGGQRQVPRPLRGDGGGRPGGGEGAGGVRRLRPGRAVGGGQGGRAGRLTLREREDAGRGDAREHRGPGARAPGRQGRSGGLVYSAATARMSAPPSTTPPPAAPRGALRRKRSGRSRSGSSSTSSG